MGGNHNQSEHINKTTFKKSHKFSPETKKKISNIIKRKYAEGVKMGGFHKGHPDLSPNAPQKQKGYVPSEKALINWANACKMTPNSKEKILIKLMKDNNLPYKFVGDGFTWIAGKNPDFLNVNGQKKLIEFFGEYWHSKWRTGKDKSIHEVDRKTHFAKYGFKTLVIWENEMKDMDSVLDKILNFDRGGNK